MTSACHCCAEVLHALRCQHERNCVAQAMMCLLCRAAGRELSPSPGAVLVSALLLVLLCDVCVCQKPAPGAVLSSLLLT